MLNKIVSLRAPTCSFPEGIFIILYYIPHNIAKFDLPVLSHLAHLLAM